MNAMIQKPILRVIDGRVTTTSMVVAAHFGKEHRHVLRAIRSLGCSVAFAERNFAQCCRINELANNKPEPFFRMTRDGFTMLAMGFTGSKAMAWKEAYIEAFNAMEAALRSGGDAACGERLAALETMLAAQARELGSLSLTLRSARVRINGLEELGAMLVAAGMHCPDAQLLGYLLRHCHEDSDHRADWVTLSMAELAQAIHWTRLGQVREALRRLALHGLIDVRRGPRQARSYRASGERVIERMRALYQEGAVTASRLALVTDANSPVARALREIVGLPTGEDPDRDEQFWEERRDWRPDRLH